MSFLATFDQLSYAKVFSIAVFMAILFAVPVGVYLVRTQTEISSRADYEKPKPGDAQLATPGPVPGIPPKIGRVFPWVGKVGDVVWVQGTGFGSNPIQKELMIGGVVVADGLIEQWDDTIIQAYIPEGARQGGVVTVRTGAHPPSQSLPIVLYDRNTAMQLRGRDAVLMNPTKQNPWVAPTEIFLDSVQSITRAIVWTGDDVIPTERHDIELEPGSGETFIFDTQGLPVLSVLLLNARGEVVPYYVDVIEWDL